MKRGSFGSAPRSRGRVARLAHEIPPARESGPIVRRSNAEAERVIRGLPTLRFQAVGGRFLSAWESWILLPQVRSHLGAGVEGLRVADLVAVEPGGAHRRVLVEVKVSRGDWLEEVLEPGKSDEIGRYCHATVLAVTSPWDRIVQSIAGELPEGWGLVEVDGGRAKLIQAPAEREALDVPAALWLSMLRSAQSGAGRESEIDVGAPMRLITRPHLAAETVGLECLHAARRPLAKGVERIPCFACVGGPDGQGWPPDPLAARALIAEATPDALRGYRAQIEDLLLGRLGGAR